MKLNKNFWKNKKVLITGHTGFKGGWLSMILNNLNAKVYGISLNPKGKINFFNTVNFKNKINADNRIDITNFSKFKKKFLKISPDIVFHLAAQSSVIESFKNPRTTLMSNVVGTTHLLELLKFNKKTKCAVIVTTDKVYQNYGKKKYFNEKSELGGDDVYSASKASCEIMIKSYRKSFFNEKNSCKIATVRAGNCFGGGDWTEHRIVKDCLDSFSTNKNLVLRNPFSTRPWQHVLEPLYGYLLLAQGLCSNKSNNFLGAWNFGPSNRQNLKVIELVKKIKNFYKSSSKIIINKNFKKLNKNKKKIFESKDLHLNSKKIFKLLGWQPILSIDKSLKFTIDWHKFFKSKKNMYKFTNEQIQNYLKLLK